jgi:hypothetical protein
MESAEIKTFVIRGINIVLESLKLIRKVDRVVSNMNFVAKLIYFYRGTIKFRYELTPLSVAIGHQICKPCANFIVNA